MLHRTACIIAYYWKLIKVSAVLTFYLRQSRDEKSGRSASADISVQFFSAGANFRAMHAKKNQQLYQHQCYQHCDHTNVLIVYWAHTVKICSWNERKPLWFDASLIAIFSCRFSFTERCCCQEAKKVKLSVDNNKRRSPAFSILAVLYLSYVANYTHSYIPFNSHSKVNLLIFLSF